MSLKAKFHEGLESSPDYLRRFYTHMDLSGKALTGEQYTRITKQLLDAVGKSPDRVKLIDIEEWLSKMKKEASERTVNKYYFALKKFFQWYQAAYDLNRDCMYGGGRGRFEIDAGERLKDKEL